MNIRHAEPEDAEEIHEVALKSWKDTYNHVLSEEAIESVITDWYAIEDLEEQAEHPIFFVAEVKNNVVGFVHATTEDRTATLHRIYIEPSHQRKGIGTKMYNKMEEELPEKTSIIELEVVADNEKGNNFYENQGFKEKETEIVELKGEKIKQRILTKNL